MGLHEIAHLLESADDAGGRVVRVLEILRRMVPCEQAALLEARPGQEPRVALAAPLPREERALITEQLVELFGTLLDAGDSAPGGRRRPRGERHLAVPLIGLDDVIGLLFVRRPAGTADFTAADVRMVSIVAAQVAAYLMMVRARAEAAEQRRELDQARRAAEAANRTKDEFLALVSHELKTPLGSILAWVHLLGATTADAEQRARAVQAVERVVGDQARLVDEILQLACVATASLRLNLRVAEPAGLLRRAIEGLRLAAERKSILLESDLDEATMPVALDADRFDQVVSTLIANAIELTPDGGRVEVRLEHAAGYARIQVEDGGPGIGRAALSRLFEPFPVAGDARAPLRRRLGLALVRAVVELHGGRVRAESAGPEPGATFTVELPRLPAAPGLPAPGGAERGPLGGVRVLLVEQDPGLRDAFGAVLEAHGAEVSGASSPAEALAAIDRARPDVLLFGDLAMPRASVHALMREMAVRTSPVPAASISAYDRPEEAERARAAGFRMHLAKPLEIGALIRAVAQLAGRAPQLAE